MRVVADPASFDQRDLLRARRLSGHGCVRCGCTVFRYCEVEGDTDLFLLCPPCIAALGGMADRDRVLAVIRANPVAMQKAFDSRPYPYVEDMGIPDTRFARGIAMRRTVIPIVFGGAPVLSLEQPEAYGGAVRLTIRLGVGDVVPQMVVRYNEWLGGEGWKFEQRPGRYTISHAGGDAMLALTFPGDGSIGIEALRSRVLDQVLEIDAAGARLGGAPFDLPSGDLQVIGITLPAR